MSMLLNRLDRWCPYLCVGLVSYSLLFPSSDIRTVRDLRAEMDEMRRSNEVLRSDFAATLQFLRGWQGQGTATGADAPQGAPRRKPALVSNGAYTRCYGIDGVRVGTDTWLVGDPSPWGVIAQAYPGGFETSDGYAFTYYPIDSERLKENDQ